MQPLNLPACPLTIRKQNNRLFVFDTQRKRYVALTPEEWVRQHFVHYLTDCLGYPAARLAVEHQIALNGMKKRCDAVLFDTDARPLLIVEVKAPTVPITQAVFDQVAVYNLTVNGCGLEGRERFGDAVGAVPVERCPEMAVFLGRTVAASGKDFDAWLSTDGKDLAGVLKDYLV